MKKYIRPITELSFEALDEELLAGSFNPANLTGGGDNGAITNENQNDFTVLGKGLDLWSDDDEPEEF